MANARYEFGLSVKVTLRFSPSRSNSGFGFTEICGLSFCDSKSIEAQLVKYARVKIPDRSRE